MKKTSKLFITILLIVALFAVCIPQTTYAYGVTPDSPNGWAYLIRINKSSISIDKGEAYQLTATTQVSGSVIWSTDNSSIATVTQYGLVVGVSAGSTYIYAEIVTDQIGITLARCLVNVSTNGIIDDAVYYIKNVATEKYAAVENSSTSNDAAIEIYQLSGGKKYQWSFTIGTDGYYRIMSSRSLKYLRVTNSLSSPGDTITQNSTITSGSKWAIMKTSSGAFAFIPASSTVSAVALNSPGTSSGYDLNTATYTNNSNYQDEWNLIRMLPTNGYELSYYASDWSNYVEDFCNCYAYAINNQVYPNTNFLWYCQQMGAYAGENYMWSSLTESNIYDAVINDYNAYNSTFNTDLIFQRIGRYDTCPAGTYKVALVVSNGDYHWYRQDADGLWSHKRGTTPVTREDESGKMIIDPYLADRGSYTEFLGYYAVTPWNGYFNAVGDIYCYCLGYYPSYDDLMEFLANQGIQSSTVECNHSFNYIGELINLK